MFQMRPEVLRHICAEVGIVSLPSFLVMALEGLFCRAIERPPVGADS